MDLEYFCQLFYASHYVPIALFRGEELEQYFSSLDRPVELHQDLLPWVRAFSKGWETFTAPDQGLYGLLKSEGDGRILLLGPVFSQPVTEKMVSAFARQKSIGNRDWSVLYWFLAGVPRYTYNQFFNLMQYLMYSINGQTENTDKLPKEEYQALGEPAAVQQRIAMYSPWETRRHETFMVENMILATIRDGNAEGLRQLLVKLGQVANLREGPVAESPLRQAKNIFLGLVCLVGKTAAIPGGMDDEETYGLIDLYSQECERATTVEAVKLLQYNMLLDFAQRVAREKSPIRLSPEIARCVQFLRAHPAGDVGIDEAAGFVGKSRAWLTRHFKEEMGQSLGEYQAYLRIQEAKRLLRYSDATLIEISSGLGFSSQAYFQTVFKKATGMTPREYRKEAD